MDLVTTIIAVLLYLGLIAFVFYSFYKSGQRDRNYKRHVLEYLEEIASNTRRHY